MLFTTALRPIAPASTRVPTVSTPRLRLDAFAAADIPALAAILAEPEVTKCITADGSTPARAQASAAHRIGWHNAAWDNHGFGVWAIRARESEVAPPGTLLGWCGFVPPDIGSDPEILYGLAPQVWQRGLAREAATGAIDWLFAETAAQGASAVVFHRLNPASLGLLGKLGFGPRGRMAMAAFLPDLKLAQSVLEYELWRLGHGKCADLETLLFQAPHKAGQIASLFPDEIAQWELACCNAGRSREDVGLLTPTEATAHIRAAFQQGLAEPWLEWLHLPRAHTPLSSRA
jgi:RimJ/RimL family protein N-acetyltransferase